MATQNIDGVIYDVDQTAGVNNRPPRINDPVAAVSSFFTSGDIPPSVLAETVRTSVSSSTSGSPDTILDLSSVDAPNGGIVLGIEVYFAGGTSSANFMLSEMTIDGNTVTETSTSVIGRIMGTQSTSSSLMSTVIPLKYKFAESITLKAFRSNTNANFETVITWMPYPSE